MREQLQKLEELNKQIKTNKFCTRISYERKDEGLISAAIRMAT